VKGKEKSKLKKKRAEENRELKKRKKRAAEIQADKEN